MLAWINEIKILLLIEIVDKIFNFDQQKRQQAPENKTKTIICIRILIDKDVLESSNQKGYTVIYPVFY